VYFFTRRISDPELLSHEVHHHHYRHVQRIRQKRWMAVTPTASTR
jgi:hypothetical protein